MSQFDQIKKKEMINAPETISSNWDSPSISLDDRIHAFSFQLKYRSGSAPVDMKVYLQLSNDDTDFATIEESLVIISDESGSVLYDLDGSGARFARITVVVESGTIDITSINYTGVQAH